ncbi:hypothetical protein GUH93_08975, partial [Xanthomonas citri pv. citri]|nr:hypothetical protein [Xanthomonas citri pv. citri]
GGESFGPRNTTAVTAQRQEVSDWYADALGEVESFTQRLTKQGQVVSKATTTAQVIQDIRAYLTENDLIEHIDTADMGAIHKTA